MIVVARQTHEGRSWPRLIVLPADLSIIGVDFKQLGAPSYRGAAA